MRVNITVRILWAVLILTVLAACGGKPDFNLTDVSGKMPSLNLSDAPNGQGTVHSASDYSGRIVVLYFGFTHCPDVCPLTLTKLHTAMQTLGDKADDIQVIFCTVDPKRDTPADLRRYVHAFDPRFSALRPTGDALAAITDRYHAGFSYEEPDASGNYNVNHSSAIYIFDGTGELRLIGSSADGADDIATDLRTLVANQ